MPGKFLPVLAAASGLLLAACTHSVRAPREVVVPDAAVSPLRRMTVKEWPLRFRRHTFSVASYDTYGCTVYYAGHRQLAEPDDKLQPSSASHGPDYQRAWGSGHAMIRNFPPPAVVIWRSKDGQPHRAEIDIGEIFRDQRIRHNVSREEMAELPDGEYRSEPSIILEVNDRTIRVWMQAYIPTRKLQKPGNPYSDFRSDPILVRTYTY